MDINKKIRIFKKPPLYITVKQIFIAVTVLMAVVAIISASFSVLRFFRVGEIKIVGMCPYERVDIMETIKLRRSDFWWSIDEGELEKKLLEERQLIEEVKVTKQLPNKIVIEVIESRIPRWYVDISGRKYALDGELYVIEEMKNTEGITKLSLPNISELMEREVPKFGQTEVETKETLKIIDTVRSSDIRSRITELDVSNRTDIILVIDGKYTARLGNSDDLSGKLVMIKNTLETDVVKNSNGGEIIAYTYSENGYASFKPN